MLPCSARAGRACATDPRPALRTERTLARPDRSAPAVVDSSAPVRRFRPEIEGLRAVAALLVAIYHIFLGRVSGGVDIFFTVAGFLITLTLLRQVGSRGTVSAKVFFSRLGRRLLPASLFVLGAVAVATAVLLPSSRRSATFGEIVASVLYVENWALASKSVDYLAREEGSSPVQHFWAMSIQGQFYVIWFVLFLVAVWLGAHRIRTTLRWILGGLFVASFGFSIYLTALDQPLAYFHTGTRVWEFAAGGLLALGIAKVDRIPPRLAAPLGWLGLALIVSCGLLLQVSELFPGWVALWPVIGGLLVLASSSAAGRGTAVRLLGSKPFVTVGAMSYAIYLWHWPILVIYLARTGRTVAPLVPGLAIIAVTLVLAYLTTRFVERPLRESPQGSRTARSGAAAMGITAVALVAGSLVGARTVSGPVIAMSDEQHPGPAAVAEGWPDEPQRFSAPPVPDLAVAKADRADVYDLGCHVAGNDPVPQYCEFGDPDGSVTIMLLGGSHSAHWQPALEAMAEDRNWRLIAATKSGCTLSTRPQVSAELRESCLDWNQAVLAEVARVRPQLVFTTSTDTAAQPEEIVHDGYLERWSQLDALGVEVLAIRDTPRARHNQVECLEANFDDPAQCAVPRNAVYADEDPTAALDLPNVTFLDLSHLMCDSERCPAIIGNVVVYFDGDHMTATWSRALAPYLDELIAWPHGSKRP